VEGLVVVCVGAAAGLAGFTQGVAGFGSTLVALPVLGAVMDARAATPLGCLMALTINLCLLARLHGRVAWRELFMLLGASVPGMALGAWTLWDAPEALLKGLLGAYLVWCGLRGQLGQRGQLSCPASEGAPHRHTGKSLPGGVATGFAAGFLGVAIGVNGPPVVAWASRRLPGRDVLRGTLAGYFLAAGVAIVGSQWAAGLVTSRVMTLFGLSLPVLVTGLAVGAMLCGRISESAFRRAVYGLLMAAGAGLVWQGLDKALAGV